MCFNIFLKVPAVQAVNRSIECINSHINEVCMKRVYIVLLVCMVFFIACGDKVEDIVGNDTVSQPQVNEYVKPETARESRPIERRPVERTSRPPVPGGSASEREDREKERLEEQHEKKVEELSDRLGKILDEYYDSDEENLDYDTLLERFRDELPEEKRYDIPEEILEEIEWWTD